MRDDDYAHIGCDDAEVDPLCDRWVVLLLRVVMWVCILAASFFMAQCVAAADTHLVVHGLSKHGRSTDATGYSYNERNYGLGVRHGTEVAGVQVSYLRNSFRQRSPYLGVEYLPFQFAGGRLGVNIGATRNYPGMNAGEWVPFAALVVRWQLGSVAPVARFIPPIPSTPAQTGVIASEIGFRIN